MNRIQIFNNLKLNWRKFLFTVVDKVTGTQSRQQDVELLHFIVLMISVIGIAGGIYVSGGAGAATHLMYLPIVLSAFILAPKKALLLTLTAGILTGPVLPLQVSAHIPQPPKDWIARSIIFMLVGIFLVNIAYYIRIKNELDQKKLFTDEYSGQPNFNSLIHRMQSSPGQNREQILFVALVHFTNLDSIYRLTNYDTRKSLFNILIKNVEEFIPECSVYVLATDKILLYAENYSDEYGYARISEYVMQQNKPMMIYDIPFVIHYKAAVTGGLTCDNANDLLLRLNKTLELLNHSHKNVIKYVPEISESVDNFYITLVDICNAVKNEEFYLVYQPKTEAENQRMSGAEVLLRWKNPKYRDIPISTVIQIAEDMGLINYITGWIINKVFEQQYLWQKKGIYIQTAINLSASDICSPTIMQHIRKCVDQYQIDPVCLEFELTERCILKDEDTIFSTLTEFQKIGIKISLDDYGTGHNSLTYLLKDQFRFDYIKIDKEFINEIHQPGMESLIQGIVNAVHDADGKVIAEGVEDLQQVQILQKIGCDHLQGYYFSRPLPLEQIEQYYHSQYSNHIDSSKSKKRAL